MTTPSLTVEQALKELREMFPRVYVSIKRQEFITSVQGTMRCWADIYIDQGQSPPSCKASTLSEAMAQVRSYWKEQN